MRGSRFRSLGRRAHRPSRSPRRRREPASVPLRADRAHRRAAPRCSWGPFSCAGPRRKRDPRTATAYASRPARAGAGTAGGAERDAREFRARRVTRTGSRVPRRSSPGPHGGDGVRGRPRGRRGGAGAGARPRRGTAEPADAPGAGRSGADRAPGPRQPGGRRSVRAGSDTARPVRGAHRVPRDSRPRDDAGAAPIHVRRQPTTVGRRRENGMINRKHAPSHAPCAPPSSGTATGGPTRLRRVMRRTRLDVCTPFG